MSVQAQVDYQYVDPVNVPARTVIGDSVLVDEASTSVASVEVPAADATRLFRGMLTGVPSCRQCRSLRR